MSRIGFYLIWVVTCYYILKCQSFVLSEGSQIEPLETHNACEFQENLNSNMDNYTTEFLENLLLLAVKADQISFIKMVIPILQERNKTNFIPLLRDIIVYNKTEILEYLLSFNVTIDEKDLFVATRLGYTSIVKLLVQHHNFTEVQLFISLKSAACTENIVLADYLASQVEILNSYIGQSKKLLEDLDIDCVEILQ